MSNIGWAQHDDPQVFRALRGHGVTGIEVAPTKVWPGWEGADESAARNYAKRLADAGFEIPALQAILFGKPELRLFDPNVADALVAHVEQVARLAHALGARVLVFGAPKARMRGDLGHAQALDLASELFARMGATCAAHDTCLCIEPNPSEYGCDFITNAADALALVERVDSAGFGLHLDAAALHMAGESIEQFVPRALSRVRHYHISEPFLVGLAGGVVPHADWLSALQRHEYERWVSVEVDATKHELHQTLATLSKVVPSSEN